MKKIVLLLILMYSSNSMAQITLRNESLIYPDSLVAYRGATNRFLISGLQDSSSGFIVAHNDTFYIHANWFNYTPHYKVKLDTLRLYQNQNFVQSFIIEVRKFQLPIIVLGELTDTLVSSKVLANNLFLSNFKYSDSENLLINNLHVVMFEIKIKKRNGKVVELSSNDERFSTLKSEKQVTRYIRKFEKKQLNDSSKNEITKHFSRHYYKANREVSRLKSGDEISDIIVRASNNDSCSRYFSTGLKFTILN